MQYAQPLICDARTLTNLIADLAFLGLVAKQMAVAVDNALNSEQLARERDRSQLLLEVNNSVTATLDLRELLAATAKSLRRVAPHQVVSLALYDPDSDRLQVHALDFAEGKGLLHEGISMRVEEAPAGLALRARRPVPLMRREIEERFDSASSGM